MYGQNMQNRYKMLYISILAIIVLTTAIFILFRFKNEPEIQNCISESNFDMVYQYIKAKLTSEDDFLVYENCNISLTEEEVIIISKNGWKIAKIFRSRGIVATAMLQSDNQKQLRIANEIFCRLLVDAK